VTSIDGLSVWLRPAAEGDQSLGMLAAAPFATSHYPWTPVLILILILLAFSIARVSRRPRPVDRALLVHQQYHTGQDARRFPEFCSYCRDELSR
jgi:hypothetical protein